MIHARAAQLFLLVQKGLAAICQFPHALEGFDAAEHREPTKDGGLSFLNRFQRAFKPQQFFADNGNRRREGVNARYSNREIVGRAGH